MVWREINEEVKLERRRVPEAEVSGERANQTLKSNQGLGTRPRGTGTPPRRDPKNQNPIGGSSRSMDRLRHVVWMATYHIDVQSTAFIYIVLTFVVEVISE